MPRSYKRTSTASQAAKAAKFAALLKRKMAIEREMFDCVKRLHKAYNSMNMELAEVVRGRAEDLGEGKDGA